MNIIKDDEDLQDAIDEAAPRFENGAVIADRYEVQRALGSGAMGDVFLVKDKLLEGQERALKILHPDFMRDQVVVQRFLREARIMQNISHSNVVRTHDVVQEREILFYTMEVIKGMALDQYITESKLDIADILKKLIDICHGLDAIHNAGIIHRDLKPSNILVLEDGSVKITDFGVSRTAGSKLTAHTEVLGTPVYMAPDLFSDIEITAGADLYSLGIIAYELVTGAPPFEDDSVARVLLMHARTIPVQPSEMNHDVPVWLNDLIMRLLEKDPEKRPLGAKDIARVIEFKMNRKLSSSNLQRAKIPNSNEEQDPLSSSSVLRALYSQSRGDLKNLSSTRRKKKLASSAPWILMAISATIVTIAIIVSTASSLSKFIRF